MNTIKEIYRQYQTREIHIFPKLAVLDHFHNKCTFNKFGKISIYVQSGNAVRCFDPQKSVPLAWSRTISTQIIRGRNFFVTSGYYCFASSLYGQSPVGLYKISMFSFPWNTIHLGNKVVCVVKFLAGEILISTIFCSATGICTDNFNSEEK